MDHTKCLGLSLGRNLTWDTHILAIRKGGLFYGACSDMYHKINHGLDVLQYGTQKMDYYFHIHSHTSFGVQKAVNNHFTRKTGYPLYF